MHPCRESLALCSMNGQNIRQGRLLPYNIHVCSPSIKPEYAFPPSCAVAACVIAGFQLDEMAFATLFSTFDPECTNWLSIAEYIAMTLFLQSASATFEAFDQQKRGNVTLNFNQWIYASANVV